MNWSHRENTPAKDITILRIQCWEGSDKIEREHVIKDSRKLPDHDHRDGHFRKIHFI